MESSVRPSVRVYPDLPGASRALARHLVASARHSVDERGRFSWVIAGGRTPQELYQLLARNYADRFPWKELEVFFGDERCVGPTSPESNFRAAWESFLSEAPVPRPRIHRMRGELRPPSHAAERYARQLGFHRTPPPGLPRFDVVLLGMGPDGHTASLFPRAPALRENRRSVVAVRSAGQPPFLPRLTMTLPALSSSREVCFLVSGSDKAQALARIFRSFPRGTPQLPASLVRSRGSIHWYLDRAAATGLPKHLRGSQVGS
ncbi:MAG: 6-phosphogluconolactonase [Thermoplasmata archaeon]|nr:6-phosphogluconolactonase [Thermoplasmata archaeon]